VTMAWPELRQDLDLIEGGTLLDGQPFWTLHDPARHQFFRIDWPGFEILCRWTLADPEKIAADIRRNTTLQMTAEDVVAVARMLGENQLLEKTSTMLEAERLAIASKRGTGLFRTLLHTYLFFRIPLAKPDAWLARHLPVARIFWSRQFRLLTAGALAAGIFLLLKQWEAFHTAAIDTLTFQGFISWGIALILVKFMHELGHAFAAKDQGCRIPTMGVVFIVMWPVAYTDTSDVWRIPDRKGRLRVATAGILTELTIASWALLAWGLLPDGGPRNAALLLAGSSWISTLLVNASPFLRFDGYFILSDLLDLPNLHQRSAALALWYLRRALFGAAGPKPENLGKVRERGLAVFAVATWVFRLIVFTGIALLVYHFFFKALGVFLFLVEIWWFILAPFSRELINLKQSIPLWWRDPKGRRHALFWVAALSLAAWGVFMPWASKVIVTGTLRPVAIQRLYAPGDAHIKAFSITTGAPAHAGRQLIILEAPVVGAHVERVNARARNVAHEAAMAPLDSRRRGETQTLLEERQKAYAELADAEREISRYVLKANQDGRIFQTDPDLFPGQWVAEKELLMVVVDESEWEVETYLDENLVSRIEAGARAQFMLEGDPAAVVSLTLESIAEDAAQELPDGMLAAQTGGHVLSRLHGRRYVPEHSVYKAILRAEMTDHALDGRIWRGSVIIDAAPESFFWRYINQLASVLLRESGA